MTVNHDVVSSSLTTGVIERLRIFNRFLFRPVGQVVKTPPFHGGIMGSNPVRVINNAGLAQLVEHRYRKPRVTGSTPAAGINSMFLPSANRDNQHCTDVLFV